MIIGLGTGEGEPVAGAASGELRLSDVRTRSQLDTLHRSAMGSHQEPPEDMDESLLDVDSETEESVGAAAGDQPGSSMELTPEEKRDGQAEHKSGEEDEGPVYDSDMVSSGHNRPTLVKFKNLDIGTGHATVIAARKAASSRRHLNPSPTTVEQGASRPNFTGGGDERVLRCNIVHNINSRITTSSSFDTKRLVCNTCVSGVHGALAGRDGQPVAMVAADQSFPACVPSTSTGECLRIVRVEDGTLQEILHALADAIGQHKLGTGTIIALGSLSHMAEVGSAQYLTDWVRSRHWLKNRFGEGTVVIPIIPVLSTEWEGRSTVRALLEVLHWFASTTDTEAILMRGLIQGYISTNLLQRSGRGWADGRPCLRAPAGFDTKAFVSLVSEGWGCRPDSIPSLSPAAESECILSFLNVLNDAFGTGLCTAPMTGRRKSDWKIVAEGVAKNRFIVVIGGSNADRLAVRLELEERQVFRLTSPGFRVTKDNVSGLVATIASLDPQPDCLIIQALDNSAFYCLQEDGTLSLPKRSHLDGKYHVEGELRVANEEQTNFLLRSLLPLLRAVPGADVLLVTCLSRYVYSSCCEDSTHVIGRNQPGFKEKLSSGLVAMKRAVRLFVHKEKLTLTRIVDPNTLLEDLDTSQHSDPVHPPSQFYVKLADKLTAILEGEAVETNSRPSEGRPEPDPKRIRLVSSSVTRGRPFQRGRGGGGRRGPWGGRGRRGF